MINEIQYTNINRVMSDLTDHPMLRDLTLEQVVRYTVRFISLHGYTKLYQDKMAEVEIEEFRGLLPCDLISIIQVKDCDTGICLRSMTDNFPKGMEPFRRHHQHRQYKDLMNNVREDVMRETHHHTTHHHAIDELYIPPRVVHLDEPAFKTQGRVIYTSFPHGKVLIAYKAIPVDDDGFPLLIDDETYIAALEAYIKKQVFTIKFDQGKISAGVLQNTQQEYYALAGQLQSHFQIPSISEMESITRMWNTLIPKVREFDNGFIGLGDREYLRRH